MERLWKVKERHWKVKEWQWKVKEWRRKGGGNSRKGSGKSRNGGGEAVEGQAKAVEKWRTNPSLANSCGHSTLCREVPDQTVQSPPERKVRFDQLIYKAPQDGTLDWGGKSGGQATLPAHLP